MSLRPFTHQNLHLIVVKGWNLESHYFCLEEAFISERYISLITSITPLSPQRFSFHAASRLARFGVFFCLGDRSGVVRVLRGFVLFFISVQFSFVFLAFSQFSLFLSRSLLFFLFFLFLWFLSFLYFFLGFYWFFLSFLGFLHFSLFLSYNSFLFLGFICFFSVFIAFLCFFVNFQWLIFYWTRIHFFITQCAFLVYMLHFIVTH